LTTIQPKFNSIRAAHLSGGFPAPAIPASAGHRSPGLNLKPKLARSASLSFSVHTVSQMNIGDVSNEVFTRYLTQQLRTSERLTERLEMKRLLIKRLLKFGFKDEADKLKRCSANVKSLVCGSGHSFRTIVDYRCHLPFCPDCANLKSRKRLAAILPKFLQALRDDPSLIIAFSTLTLRSDKAENRSLRDGCKELKSSFRKLRKRDIWSPCVGGFGAIENTYSEENGWHPHSHNVLLLKNYIPQKGLSDAMYDITGDSKIVDIRTVHNLASGLVECIKYPFKPADIHRLGKAEIQEMLDLKGERLCVPFGILHGIEVDDDIEDDLKNDYSEFMQDTKTLEIGDACPVCNSRLDLIDFSADSYAGFLASVPNKFRVRGSPD
jgi:hypothetical protein